MTDRTTPTVMVVDDERHLRALIETTLQHHGYATIPAASAEAAEQILSTRPIDLALVDMVLPGRSGMDLLKTMNKEFPRVASIVVSSVDDLNVAVETLRIGAYDYLRKPFAEHELVLRVHRALERRRLLLANEKYHHDLETLVSERTVALEQALKTLEATYDQTILALGAALDLRDTETNLHCHRVASYSVRLATELGEFNSTEMRHLRWGAYLHDVGKIGVPDAILRKPGPLIAEERALIERHPEFGRQILSAIPFLKGAVTVVYSHHERFDGTGYPQGIAGAEIPISARIFAVADAVDAMTSDRPYRRAMDWSAVRGELIVGAKTQFDPLVVSALLSIREQEWKEIVHRSGSFLTPDSGKEGGMYR